MTFHEAMYEVLETSRYDFLTGRRVDIRQVISDFINDVLNWIFGNAGIDLPAGSEINANMIVTIFTIVAVLIGVVAVAYFVRAYRKNPRLKRHKLEEIFEEARNHTVTELLDMSVSAENQRLAVRYKYIAALLWLDENDIIDIKPSATNRIVAYHLKSSAPHLYSPFLTIAYAFEYTWFGKKAINDADFASFDSAVGLIVASSQKS
jgi:hypothetical protein